MEHLVYGVRSAIARECWYAGLALALTLPDACAAIETPEVRVGERYRRWTDQHIRPYVTEPHLTSDEFYRIRCAFLHEGDFTVEPARGNTPPSLFGPLDHIKLYVGDFGDEPAEIMPSRQEFVVHSATPTHEVAYAVAVKDLCEWICLAVEQWLQHARNDPALAVWIDRLSTAARIRRLDRSGEETPI